MVVGPQLPPDPRRPAHSLRVCNAPVEVLIDAHGVPAVYARRIRGRVVCRRRAARARSAMADGALSPRDDGPAVGGARRHDDSLRSAIPDARPARRGEGGMGARRAAGESRRSSAMRPASMRRRRTMVGRMRPIEFQLLGITPPEWEPIDSLAVGRLLTWRLAENHQAELVRAALDREVWRDGGATVDRRVSVVGAGDPAGRPTGAAPADRRQPRQPR